MLDLSSKKSSFTIIRVRFGEGVCTNFQELDEIDHSF